MEHIRRELDPQKEPDTFLISFGISSPLLHQIHLMIEFVVPTSESVHGSNPGILFPADKKIIGVFTCSGLQSFLWGGGG